VVRFIGAAFKDGSIAMVLALCSGGSLLSALEKKKLDAAAKTRILRETASALSFLHSLGIVHRDIAARNVLLDGHGVAKLADLGMSRVLEDKQGEQTTANNVGPIRWMAPEAIRSKKYSAASDCFSFAILMG
jgi:serine/threonine protein kinase